MSTDVWINTNGLRRLAMPSRKARKPIARLFRPGEWTVELTPSMVWKSKDAPLLRETIQSRWERTRVAPELGDVVAAFVQQIAAEFACDYELAPDEPDDGEIRLY